MRLTNVRWSIENFKSCIPAALESLALIPPFRSAPPRPAPPPHKIDNAHQHSTITSVRTREDNVFKISQYKGFIRVELCIHSAHSQVVVLFKSCFVGDKARLLSAGRMLSNSNQHGKNAHNEIPRDSNTQSKRS